METIGIQVSGLHPVSQFPTDVLYNIEFIVVYDMYHFISSSDIGLLINIHKQEAVLVCVYWFILFATTSMFFQMADKVLTLEENKYNSVYKVSTPGWPVLLQLGTTVSELFYSDFTRF